MNKYSILFGLGIVIIVVGAVLAVSSGHIFSYILENSLPLTPTSESFKQWMAADVPMRLDFYFLNWTNPEEFLEEGKKPILEQRGPYRYREVHEKVNVTWNDNGTISYKRVKRWFFDAENSNGTLQDEITSVNVVAASAAYVSRRRNMLLQMSLSTAMRATKQQIWVTKTVDELLFAGYSDPLLTMAASMPKLAQTKIPADKFGWFYKRNGSENYDGVFNVQTGATDLSKIGFLSNWNYNNRTDFYGEECGMVNGSSGELFPPYRKKREPLHMYASDLCRSVRFDYDGENEVYGILGYKYIGGKYLMDNGTDDPSTSCFCGGECVRQGILNVSSCRFGAPAFVSYPHFLDADPYYVNQVEGLNPDPELHRFRITLEPTTGIPLDVSARFQINILLQPSNLIALYNDVPKTFFPMMWFDQRATITPEMAQNLSYLLMLPNLGLYVAIIMLFIGMVIVVLSLLPRVCRTWTIPKIGDERNNGAVLYKRECIRPLIKGIPERTGSSQTEALDPPDTTSTPA